MRIKLTVSYDGTNFCGWQRQKNGVSIQEVIETALSTVTQEKIKIVGSGRTDAGVHALGQVAHFDTESKIPPEKFCYALNAVLPPEIKILKSERVSENFNATRTAKKKTYRYLTYISNVELPLKERYAFMLEKNVDLKKMINASKIFIGTHDFKCFNASGGGALTTVRTVYSIKITKKGNEISFSVCGNGFLYNMVRIMVGALIKVGEGKATEKDLLNMLETGKRPFNYKTLPAKGLTLVSVKY